MDTQQKQLTKGRRSPRRDGISTRSILLEAAGKVFAERGYSDATSKDICDLAGTNTAAVNYHFGGKERLYEEVLVEAHKQFVSLEDITAIMDMDLPAQEKLRKFLSRLFATAMKAEELWGIKVFLRELASPSPMVSKSLADAIFPKSTKLRILINQISGLPPDSPAGQRATAFVVLPCISLIMFPSKIRTQILPATAVDDGLLDDLVRYALAGLKALGEKEPSDDLPASP